MVTEQYIAKILRKYGYHPDDQIARRMIQEVERDTRHNCAETVLDEERDTIPPSLTVIRLAEAHQAIENAVLDAREESGE